jgi:hypothetical protein
MADKITDSRARLAGALASLLPLGRVSQYVPKQVVAPTIWIERHSWSSTNVNGAAVVALNWRIVAATDSDDDQAVLDELSSQIYDAVVRARFRPLFADFTVLDIGGVSTTALVVTVEENIAAVTMCLPPQATPIKKELISA